MESSEVPPLLQLYCLCELCLELRSADAQRPSPPYAAPSQPLKETTEIERQLAQRREQL